MRALLSVLPLAACVSTETPLSYPFAGDWDCGKDRLAITDTTYEFNGDILDILDVSEEADLYVLALTDGVETGLMVQPNGTLRVISLHAGDSLACRPLR